MKKNKINIKTSDGNYPILIGRNLSSKLGNILLKNFIIPSKILLVVDKKVPKGMIHKIIKSLTSKYFIFYFTSNEKNKSQFYVNKILNVLLKNNFSRSDCIISIGGGITGDLTGYVASIFKRGINYVNIPTTLLAQVDSSIGGKTSINSTFGKNLIGTFYQPKLVISDISFLKSLGKREIICGYAEILKHSLILNKNFFNFLDKNINYVLNLKNSYIEKAIFKSCLIKKHVVEKDFKEKGLRKLLNFGHTFGHAYEASFGYSKKLNHGEAVILGMKSAIEFSHENKILIFKDYKKISNHILKINKNLKINNYFKSKKIQNLIRFMINDKKNTDNNINLILLKKIGQGKFNYRFSRSKLENFFINHMKSI